jgi:hypothetical protein
LALSSSLTTETSSYLEVVTHEGVSGPDDLREEILVAIPHEKHSQLKGIEERYNAKGFDVDLIFHCGDHESFILESPLKDKILVMEEIIEHISCGPANKKVYASMDWMDRCMTDIDTLWDTGSVDIRRVLDTLFHIGYRVVQENKEVWRSIHGYTLTHNGVQCSFGLFRPGGPHDIDLEKTIEFSLPSIGEYMGDIHRVLYPSMIYIHMGYRQMRDRYQDTHKSSSPLHYEYLVMSLGLNNT